ncbi:MAG: hypothetical protein HRT58_09950 [Crocinitomicaceae bacterium]|nr:hypothetical protein [Flavobacteriales bacterium]NQZ35977.1 hypothetical protein [Crocinitomicaceae bacterium]
MRKLLFLLSFIVLGSSSIAQITANSPYSSFGLGEEGGLDHATISGIGNSFGTAIDSFTLNYYNPSSYNSLSTGNPLFSTGISSRISSFTEGSLTNVSTLSAIQHFAFGFKVKDYFGMAFGLKPYSRRGYEFSNYTLINTDSIKHTYSGTGGINELFLGFSTNIFKLRSTQLSVGANFGYLFGSLENQRSSTLVNDGFDITGGVDIKTMRAKSFHYDLGMNFTHKFNQSNALMITAVIDPGQNIATTYSYGRYYSTDVNNTNVYDTLEYSGLVGGIVQSIPRFTYGLRYTISSNTSMDANKKLNSALAIHASYSTADYTNFTLPFDTVSVNFSKSTKYTLGFEFIPETDFINNKPITKFYERIRYRVGTYYALLPYQTDGKQVTDFGTTFGLGLPVVIKNSLSSINFGFTIGQRGVGNQQSLGETYYGINFGVTIAPLGDNWFQKRKLN